VAREAAELVRAGLSTLEALTAAGWGARRWLHRSGLEEGARADLVVYPADPRTDIRILAAPEHVIMGGSVVT
jgi:imidazolonepropionase-like amidohydrolase